MARNEILEFVRERLDPLPDSELESITFNAVREELIPKFGSDEVGSLKSEIKSFLGEYIASRGRAAAAAAPGDEEGESKNNDAGENVEESEDGDSEESDSTDSSSDSDDDHPTIATLPEEWRESFGEICWVKGQKSFPWWPAYIYNPSRLTEKLKQKAIPVAGKKHTVMYFGSKDFGFVAPNQIRTPFEDFVEEFSQQKMSKKDLTVFEKAIPEARDELAKPKEARMFIPRPQRKRKASTSTKKKTATPPKPTPKKKTPVKAKPAEPEPESEDPESEDEVEEEEEEEVEEEVVSEEESEAEFDESPKKVKTPSKKEKPKKDKAARKKTPKDESLSTAELVDKYRVKSHADDASKKKRAITFIKSIKKALPFPTSGTTDGKPTSSKSDKSPSSSNGPSKKKPREDSVKSKPESTQKKRKAEEEAMAEAERERIKKLQKSSDVPVWKQVRKDSESDVVPAAKSSKREGDNKKGASNKVKLDNPPLGPKIEETREQRAKRLTGLIDLHLKKAPPNVEAALKCMGKARDMNLTIEELRASGFAEAINQLRKFDDPEISKEAKSIRNYLKQALTLQGKTEIGVPESSVAAVVISTVEEKSSTPFEEEKGMDVVVQEDQGSGGDRADNTSPPAEDDLLTIPAIDTFSPHFQTSVALLLDSQSAVQDFSREDIERIVSIVTRLYPDSPDVIDAYAVSIHKFAFELKNEKHSLLLQALRTNPSVSNIEYLARNAVEEWTSLPDRPAL